jgi:D-sedoheptulose 7-phosphate isomerase
MMKTVIQTGLRRSAEVSRLLAESADITAAIESVAQACISAFRAGNKMLLVGNGGSAADCQHIAGELVARFNFDRPGLPAVALTVDTSTLTAIGNDYGYERLFSRQVEALGMPGDILFAYSTSGSSPNILAAIAAARTRGMRVVGLTGLRDSPMAAGACDFVLRTPSTHTPHIQEGHLVIGHMICQLIESELFADHSPGNTPDAAGQ